MTTQTTGLKDYLMVCEPCGFTTHDQPLMENHSCEVQSNGGHCEDYPCCGHEWGDCNGEKYGSDEVIKEYTMAHVMCDHENGIYECEEEDEYDD
jgi:hypothetical protein